MKGVDLHIDCIPIGDFHDRLKATVEHTLQTVSAAHALFYDQRRFQENYQVDVSHVATHTTDFQSMAMLMFLHDFYKITEQRNHATNAAYFLSVPQNINLIRYHDVLGIIHTGEASLLFLEPLVESIRALPEDQRSHFLNSLLIITVVDVASLGFLTQPRVNTYLDVMEKLNRVIQGKDLAEIAKEDTSQRILRLICSNNRFKVDPPFIDKRLFNYQERDDLLEQLLYVRFDAGWVEP